MTYRLVAPRGPLHAELTLPASKSICNRVLILRALSRSPYPIENLSDCDDTSVLIRALSAPQTPYDVGAAGTSMRFLTAYLALQPGASVITGSERMKQRPIALLVDALRTLGAHIAYLEQEGYPPLSIQGGNLHGGDLTLPGNISSQYISALLMIAPLLKEGLRLQLTGKVISRPYIEMTRRLMAQFGVSTDFLENCIVVPHQTYRPIPFRVEGDWSAASYWYELAALTPNTEIKLLGLERNSTQGDAAIARYFELFGVTTRYEEEGVRLLHTDPLQGPIVLDLSDQPDMAQTLVVTAVLQKRPFRFTGLGSLRIKETDRLAALQIECAKLGANLEEEDGSVLSWDGVVTPLKEEPIIHTYDDHRMAMAFAPAAIRYQGLCIQHPEVVSKSYPSFWDDLRTVGFKLEEVDAVKRECVCGK